MVLIIGPPPLWIQPGRSGSGTHGEEAREHHGQEGGQINR